MMVKSMSRKLPTFRQLVDYLDRGAGQDMPIFWNLVGTERGEIVREFEEWYARLPERKGGNALLHEVLSFHTKDEGELSLEALYDLSEEYLRLRAPRQLAYARIHREAGKNPHVHFCLSAGDAQGRRVCLSRVAFERVKKKLEMIQLERYPALTASKCQGVALGRGGEEKRREGGNREPRRREDGVLVRRDFCAEKVRRAAREREMVRAGKSTVSRKVELQEIVMVALEGAKSRDEFEARLREAVGPSLVIGTRGKSDFIEREEVIKSGPRRAEIGRRRYRLDTLLGDRYKGKLLEWEKGRARAGELEKLRERDGRELGCEAVRGGIEDTAARRDHLAAIRGREKEKGRGRER